MPFAESEALSLVQQGWSELQRQRPLAAWACWQQALRVRPDDPAASQALEVLASAADLPAAARETYRLRAPESESARQRWNQTLQGADLGQLEPASEAFADLFDADPTDASARYNQALALAWQGRQVEAIRALDDVVHLQSRSNPEAAERAWVLAEVLRQGAGAESLADDINEGLTISWTEADGDPRALAAPGLIREVASPVEPAEGPESGSTLRVFEWLDRPMPDPERGASLEVPDVPRVFATLILAAESLRLFAPRRGAGEAIEAALAKSPLDLKGRLIDPETTPLTLRLLDADALAFRLPEGLDPETRQRLSRESIEHYYEHTWLLQPRFGLSTEREDEFLDEPPAAPRVLDAARLVVSGDPVARVKLSAVVRLREQLSARPRVALLYGGYPFDRLRRRLGLEPEHAGASAPEDVTAMSVRELEGLDPSALDNSTLLDAFRSARGLQRKAVTSRFLGVLLERNPSVLRRDEEVSSFLLKALDPQGADVDQALDQMDVLTDHSALYRLWKARFQVQCDRLDEALETYRAFLDEHPDDASAAVEAAEFARSVMGDPEFPDAARELAVEALERAGRTGDAVSAWQAQRVLDRIDRERRFE